MQSRSKPSKSGKRRPGHGPTHIKSLVSKGTPRKGAGDGGSVLSSADAASTLENHDIPQLFEVLQSKRADKQASADRLRQTLDEMASNPSLFEPKDLTLVASIYKQRAAEVGKIDNNLNAFQHLYDTHIRDLQARVDQRAQALQDIDASLGTLSGEPQLLEYFTRQQAEMQGLIAQAKQLLVSSIVENLGPAVYGTPDVAVPIEAP